MLIAHPRLLLCIMFARTSHVVGACHSRHRHHRYHVLSCLLFWSTTRYSLPSHTSASRLATAAPPTSSLTALADMLSRRATGSQPERRPPGPASSRVVGTCVTFTFNRYDSLHHRRPHIFAISRFIIRVCLMLLELAMMVDCSP